MPAPLPIDAVLSEVLGRLRAHGAVVLVGPTGSGKTTRVPPAVLDAGIVGEGTVVVVQPRRVAARLAARRIAAERGGRVGGEVGYRVRFDTRVSGATRIEIVTEGVLVRRLLGDPFLEGVGAVVLDELHERSLDGDVALALLREIRTLRPDLAVVVMSATLDPAPVADFLGAEVVQATGRTFPVEIAYDERPVDRDSAARVPTAVREALRQAPDGHVLAFLPGVRDIERSADALADLDVPVLPLHGRLRAEAQDAALAPSDRRKIVLATNIAETSVTLEGVTAVVDSGLEKAAWFDPALGITRLERGPISKASAGQRAGRAGRTRPGWCRRLWTAAEHLRRPTAAVPEIRRSDLAETVLLLRAWGTDPETLAWFEAPEPAALERARWLLERLGALDGGELTEIGRTLARLPVHPRLGRLVVEGHRRGFLSAAATVAALAEERDSFPDPSRLPAGDGDLERRLRGLADPARYGAHRGRAQRVSKARDQLVAVAWRQLGRADRDGSPDAEDLRAALLTGFPDRVARQGRGRHYKLAEGGGAELVEESAAVGAPWIVAVSVDAGRHRGRTVARIRAATRIDLEDLPVEATESVRFEPERETVVRSVVRRYGDLVLDEVPADGPGDPDAIAGVLAAAAAADPERVLEVDDRAEKVLARLALLRAHCPELELPDLDPVALLPELCRGRRSFADLQRIDLAGNLLGRLGWDQ